MSRPGLRGSGMPTSAARNWLTSSTRHCQSYAQQAGEAEWGALQVALQADGLARLKLTTCCAAQGGACSIKAVLKGGPAASRLCSRGGLQHQGWVAAPVLRVGRSLCWGCAPGPAGTRGGVGHHTSANAGDHVAARGQGVGGRDRKGVPCCGPASVLGLLTGGAADLWHHRPLADTSTRPWPVSG